MRNLIILATVAVACWFSRHWINAKLVLLIKNHREKKPASKLVKEDSVQSSIFSPKGTVRTFVIAINLEESGGGEVKISLAKAPKDLKVIE